MSDTTICSTCGGSMHEPCPWFPEAAKQATELVEKVDERVERLDLVQWIARYPNWGANTLTRFVARSLRLAKENADLKEVMAHDVQCLGEKIQENAALQQRVKELEEPLHASAPEGYRCADCTMDKEPCPVCYWAWWEKRHPYTHVISNRFASQLTRYGERVRKGIRSVIEVERLKHKNLETELMGKQTVADTDEAVTHSRIANVLWELQETVASGSLPPLNEEGVK